MVKGSREIKGRVVYHVNFPVLWHWEDIPGAPRCVDPGKGSNLGPRLEIGAGPALGTFLSVPLSRW